MFARVGVRVSVRARVYVCSCERACICSCARVCLLVCACVYLFVSACMFARVHVRVSVHGGHCPGMSWNSVKTQKKF